MTEKRFTYEYDEYNGNLFDNKYNTFYHIEDSEENIELLCQRLNKGHEENQRLKHTLEKKEELLRDVLKVNDNMVKRIRELKDEGR